MKKVKTSLKEFYLVLGRVKVNSILKVYITKNYFRYPAAINLNRRVNIKFKCLFSGKLVI